MPEAAALATDLYIEIRQLPNRLVQGESVTELWHHIKEKLSTSTLPDEVSIFHLTFRIKSIRHIDPQ